MNRNQTTRLSAAFASMVITFSMVSGIAYMAKPPVSSMPMTGSAVTAFAG